MKTLFRILFFITLVSCSMFEEKQEHQFIYGFENEDDITTENINKVKQIFTKRLGVFGNNFEISSLSEKDIMVKIKSNNLDKERVNNILINQGKLEFWECYNAKDVLPLIVMFKDSLNESPLQGLVMPSNYNYGAVLFNSKNTDADKVLKILNHDEVKSLVSKQFEYFKFLKGMSEPDGNIPYFAVKSNKNEKALVTGENITIASQGFDHIDRPAINIQMNEQGATNWEYLTGQAFSNQTKIAITLNDLVYSAPGVTTGPITGGNTQISGDYTLEEAQDLALILSASGSIPKLKLIEYTKLKKE